MKNFILTLFIITSSLLAQLNIAVVNMNELSKAYNLNAQRKEQIEQTQLKLQKEFKEEEKSLLTAKENFVKTGKELERASFALSEAGRREKAQNLAKLREEIFHKEREFQVKVRKAEINLRRQEAKLNQITFNEISSIVQKYAERNSFDLIIEKSVAIYSKNFLDITANISKIVND